MSSFSDPEKKKLISNAVIKSHFSYCLVISTFSFRNFNKVMNGIHRKSLSTVYHDMTIRESHFNKFYNLVKVSVFTIKISKS